MLDAALMALASTGGNALVTAMATDGWESAKARIAKIFGRGKKTATQAAAARLEKSRTALRSAPDPGQAQAEQQLIWRTRLADLLEQHPGTESDLRAAITEIQAHFLQINQQANARDQAQQAVLGQGTMNVDFGGQHGQAS